MTYQPVGAPRDAPHCSSQELSLKADALSMSEVAVAPAGD